MSKILNTSEEFYFAIFGEYSIATYSIVSIHPLMYGSKHQKVRVIYLMLYQFYNQQMAYTEFQ